MSQSQKREKYDRKICVWSEHWQFSWKKQCLKNRAGSYATEIKEQSKRKPNSIRAGGLCTYVQLWKVASSLVHKHWGCINIIETIFSSKDFSEKNAKNTLDAREVKKEPWKNATDEGKIFG